MLRWFRRWREKGRILAAAPELSPALDPLEELLRIVGNRMTGVLAFTILIPLTGQATKAEAYACNNRYYVNTSRPRRSLAILRARTSSPRSDLPRR